MEVGNLVLEMKDCAIALYQNREQEAYQKINRLLPEMNQVLHKLVGRSEELEKIIVFVLTEFLEDFEKKDNLGLADLLGYTIPGMIMDIAESE